jgi:hypothetical protein
MPLRFNLGLPPLPPGKYRSMLKETLRQSDEGMFVSLLTGLKIDR